MNPIGIIGAGLAGLTAAYRLQQKGIPSIILEASNRPGGRVLSLPAKQGIGFLEMGPTWFGAKHTRLMCLIRELDLDYFEQYEKGKGIYQVMSFVPPQVFQIPDGQEAYYRFAGGTQALVRALLGTRLMAPQKIEHTIQYGMAVDAVRKIDEGLEVITSNQQRFTFRALIITVPLPLIVEAFRFTPVLSPTLTKRFRDTQTWMSDSIKFALEYKTPFWREAGFAGLLMSQNGPIKEMHDHCDPNGTTFALMGFLHAGAGQMDKFERETKVIQQIAQHYGPEAMHPLAYNEVLWANQPLTSEQGVQPMTMKPHYGHPDLQKGYWNNRLFFACAETDDVFGGYMDGAVRAAERVVNQVEAEVKD